MHHPGKFNLAIIDIIVDKILRTPYSRPSYQLLDPLPGKLKGTIRVTFHTGDAVAMVNGRPMSGEKERPKASICGLKAFSLRTHQLMDAYAKDDPFAAECLVRISQRVEDVQHHMTAQTTVLQETAQQRLAVQVEGELRAAYDTTTFSIEPVTGQLNMGIYGSRALHCLALFDELVLLAKGYHHHLVISQPECRVLVHEGGRRLRGLLSLGQNWMFTLCTRKDLTERNRVAVQAIKKLTKQGFIDLTRYETPEQVFDTFAQYAETPLHAQQTETPTHGITETP